MIRGVIPPVPIEEIPAEYRQTADMMSRLVGDATTIQVFAHSMPSTDFYFQTFYRQMFYNERPGLKVDQHLKQVMRLRISKRHGCALCNRANEEEVRALGLSEAQVDAFFEDEPSADLFDEAELAVIAFTDQMVLTNQDGSLDRPLYDRLRRSFSDEQIVEMAMVAAVLIGAAKMTFVLDLVPREAVCEFAAPTKPLVAA
ncbi:carboxymuconolactone decarboxylase family protein [Sphingomonas sp.]|uniref:carboxymuconolactone decarboxylase family protein n=1 Tax=Sphingomonas sp. TaxID=28214 RepID=UPI003B00C8F6